MRSIDALYRCCTNYYYYYNFNGMVNRSAKHTVCIFNYRQVINEQAVYIVQVATEVKLHYLLILSNIIDSGLLKGLSAFQQSKQIGGREVVLQNIVFR